MRQTLCATILQKSYTGSRLKQADGCPGGRYIRIGLPDNTDLIPLEAREGTGGGGGAPMASGGAGSVKGLKGPYGGLGELRAGICTFARPLRDLCATSARTLRPRRFGAKLREGGVGMCALARFCEARALMARVIFSSYCYVPPS